MKRTGADSFQSWIIAAGCCFINTMMFGMARLSGVLFVASVPRFNVTREEASVPYTLSQAVRNTAGPLVGYLGHKFGVRLVASIGSIIAAIGIGCCYLAENIKLITVLWGVIFGLGFGLGSILLPISINQHFDKKRATASGISFSGACIGSFILPPVVEYLINNYGLSQTFLFLSGFVLNCLPAALLLRRPSSTPTEKNRDEEKQSITYGKKVKLYTVDDSSLRTGPELHNKNITIEKSPNYASPLNYESIKKNEKQKIYEDLRSGQSKFNNPAQPATDTRPPLLKFYEIAKIPSQENSETVTKALSSESLNKTLLKEQDSNTYSRSYEYFSYTNMAYQEKTKEDFKTLSNESSSFASKLSGKQSALGPFGVIFDPIFILIALSNAIYSSTFVCMITILVDFARDLNVGESNEKYIIMSLSVGDLIGRLCLGWVTDAGYMTRSNFAAACFFFQGITTIIIPSSSGFTMLVIMAALYGLSEAGFILIFPLTVAEFIEEDKQTIAIPTSYFLSGPLCLTVAPLIGFFREGFGSYDFIFYGIGILSFICTIFWYLVPCIARRRRPF